MTQRAQHVGIKALEIYFPNQCVEQSALEKFDGVSAGKYTVGLGQTKMAFCDDREDIYSMALTTVSSLMRKYEIDPHKIGRLEVGTETLLDKSKSVKSVLMQLFEGVGNTNVEGVDTVNACYGGTNALFNAVNWVESSAWDGRDAIVVAGDIALYGKGAARPTGGAGCVAMLIGPDAPITLEPGLRGSYMAHVYDFYKPDPTSEYPYVDGHYSVTCYTRALDACYRAYNDRESKASQRPADAQKSAAPLDRFDHVLFHSPTCKTVAKSYGRLLYNDYRAQPDQEAFSNVPKNLRELQYEASLTDKEVERSFVSLSKDRFQTRVAPSTTVPTMCGNMYCASVYSSLVSLVSAMSSQDLQGRRIGVFSYGSGLASSFFSLRVRGSTTAMATQLDLEARLAARKTVSPEVYDHTCDLRAKAHLQKDYQPQGDPSQLTLGTYYLTKVDSRFQRSYSIRQ